MPEVYRLNYMKRYFRLHRVFYVVLLSIVILCKVLKLSPEPTTMAYYIVALILCWVMDEYFLMRKFAVPAKYFSLRAFLGILILSGGTIFGPPHAMEFIPFLLFCLLFVFEDMILNDIFDDFGIFIRRVLNLLIIEISMVLCFREMLTGVWFILDILIGAVMVGVVYIMFHGFVDGIRLYETKATQAHFAAVNLEEERNQLMVYQDRVRQVNSEINFQKMNLVKANRNLESMNEEVRSLIEVMKSFTTNFDIPENARYMMENIMKLKKPTACAMYIDRDIYMNEEPYCEILTAKEDYEAALSRDIYSIFEKIRRRHTPEPLVLCRNNDFTEGLLSDTNASNAVAFPAFENDTYYGVLVVVSGNYDFFENGYAFYESSLVDFTAAVRSAKLYLQMKDMATKDGLTGVYNRAYFNEIYPSICAKCIVNEQSLSVALLDIDKFKSINDTYGHLAGDDVIRMVASVDQKYAQLHNGYAVRYGGEEFLLILQGYSVDEFYVILEEVQEDIIRNIVHYEGEEIHVNASIGMSNYPEIAEEIVDVLDQSDRAMYFSKENGRGMIVIYGREEESLKERQLKEAKKSEESKDSKEPKKPEEPKKSEEPKDSKETAEARKDPFQKETAKVSAIIEGLKTGKPGKSETKGDSKEDTKKDTKDEDDEEEVKAV